MSKTKLLFKAKPKGPVRVQQNQTSSKINQLCEASKQQQKISAQINIKESFQIKVEEKEIKNSEQTKKFQQYQNEQQKNQPKREIKQKYLSSEALKILNIFSQKQSKQPKQSKQSKQQKQQRKQNLQQQKILVNHKTEAKNQPLQKQKGAQTQSFNRTCKHIGKHYKRYNPQHFKDENIEQVKTSNHRWTYGTGQTPDQLMISSWNVNGIRARISLNQIQPYVQNVKPDIFCINEHKMDEKSYDLMPIKFWGYYGYWNFPKYSLGYSGVAIFSKYPAISMYEDLHDPQHSKQGRVITLQFDKFILIHVYIPTSGRQLQRLKYRVQQYDPAFRDYLLNVKSKYPSKMVIICGDMNVAHQQIDCHTGKRMKQGKQPAFTLRERTSFSNLLTKVELIDAFRYLYPNKRAYTWWNMRIGGRKRAGETGIGKRLDYFLITKEHIKYVKAIQIKKEIECNDHSPVQMKVSFK